MPATLKDRAIFAAEAFAREDYRRLRAVAAPGSSGAVARWMDQVRPRFWKGKIQRVSVKVEIPQQDKKAGKAVVLAHVVAVTGLTKGAGSARASSPTLAIPAGRPSGPVAAAAAAEPPAAPDNRRIDLTLHWVTTRDGQWWLDWSRTAGVAKPARAAAGPDRTARSSSD